jgi:hypothetical protein
VKLLPRSRRGKVALAGGLLAALLAAGTVDWWRPWEVRYKGRPSSWWEARACELVMQLDGGGVFEPPTFGVWNFPRSGPWAWLARAGFPVEEWTGGEWPLRGLLDDPAAAPVLIELLHSRHTKARRFAAFALGRVGRSAAPEATADARAALLAARDDADEDVRAVVFWAISDLNEWAGESHKQTPEPRTEPAPPRPAVQMPRADD